MGRRAAAGSSVLLAAFAAGCVAAGPEATDLGDGRSAIVGGELEEGFPAAGVLVAETPAGAEPFCSATALSPLVLLTAAHCLAAVPASALRFEAGGEGPEPGPELDLASVRIHPTWDRAMPVHTGDLALVRLDSPLALERYPLLRSSPLGPDDLGTTLVAVGFGRTGPEGGAGEKRSVRMALTAIAGSYYSLRVPEPEPSRGLCHGDSGGGSFLAGAPRDLLHGVHSVTLDGACGTGADASAPRFFEGFLRPALLELDPGAETCGDRTCTALESAETCPADCAPPGCGDGRLDPGEACDDGGHEPGDGCSADCASREACGDGVVDPAAGETCEPGHALPGTCGPDCRYAPACGNGILDVEAPEGCDDGNLEPGDGCSPDCFVEDRSEPGAEPDPGDPEPDEDHLALGCACRAAAPGPARSTRATVSVSWLLAPAVRPSPARPRPTDR